MNTPDQQPVIAPQPAKTKKEKAGGVAFILSVLFHGGILLLIGGIVLIPAVVQKAAFNADPTVVGQQQDIPLDEPPLQDPSLNELPPSEAPKETMELSEPTPSTVPNVDIVVTREDANTASPWVSVNPGTSVKVGDVSKLMKSGEQSSSENKKPIVGGKVTLFGSTEQVAGGSLKGTMYDFKQDRSGKPKKIDYVATIRSFVDSGFKASVMRDIYSVKKPMYLTQLYIPMLPATEAPKAFDVEKDVQPSQWIIHYSGVIQYPFNGSFRFAGYADDALVVAIDGKVVLDGSRNSCEGVTQYKSAMGDLTAPVCGNGRLAYSDWITPKQGETHTMDIILGERPGGSFCAFLMYEMKAGSAQKDPKAPISLPLFRMSSQAPFPENKDINLGPEVKKGGYFGVEKK